MGAITQVRIMGAVICLAIVTAAFGGFTRSRLADILSDSQVNSVFSSAGAIASLPPNTQVNVRAIFSDGYDLQVKILAGFAGGQLLSALLVWRKDQIRV